MNKKKFKTTCQWFRSLCHFSLCLFNTRDHFFPSADWPSADGVYTMMEVGGTQLALKTGEIIMPCPRYRSTLVTCWSWCGVLGVVLRISLHKWLHWPHLHKMEARSFLHYIVDDLRRWHSKQFGYDIFFVGDDIAFPPPWGSPPIGYDQGLETP